MALGKKRVGLLPSPYLTQVLKTQQYKVNRILTALDPNSKGDVFAVVASLIDWNNAFPRQCPTLGLKYFMENGVQPSLIPVLSVKWHGCRSAPKHIKGGGPQGATLGLLEYMSQSNKSADCVDVANRFKFVDDLTILEVVNLLTVGITSYNIKQQVPSDISSHNQYIPSNNLESQDWLNKIGQKIRRL